MSATEFWVWQVKEGKTPIWNGGFTQSNVIITPITRSMERMIYHKNQKPLSIIKGFILRHSNPGDTILDPYMGSGTTLVAAKELGRFCIGIELDEKFCEIAQQRLSQSIMNLEE